MLSPGVGRRERDGGGARVGRPVRCQKGSPRTLQSPFVATLCRSPSRGRPAVEGGWRMNGGVCKEVKRGVDGEWMEK